MRNRNVTVSVGDWVEAYSPGISQVIHIMSDFYELRFSLEQQKRKGRRAIVFVKRMVDDNWRKAFKVEGCSPDVVRPLIAEEREQLEKYTASHPEIVAEFDAMRPKLPDHGMGFRLRLPDPSDLPKARETALNSFAGIENGYTNDEVLYRMKESPLAQYLSDIAVNAQILFHGQEHEVRNGEFVFREVDVQRF